MMTLAEIILAVWVICTVGTGITMSWAACARLASGLALQREVDACAEQAAEQWLAGAPVSSCANLPDGAVEVTVDAQAGGWVEVSASAGTADQNLWLMDGTGK